MENTIIKRQNFENSKDEIQKLLSKMPSTVSFQPFQTEGFFFSHKITGSEANEKLLSPLQSTLIAQNKNITKLLGIASEVYKALDFLDREYINGLVDAVKASEIASNQATTASSKAETASDQALEASKEALEASFKAGIAQEDIKKTIEALKITVSSLKEFKNATLKELSALSSLSSQVTSVRSIIKSIEQGNADFSSQLISTKDSIQDLEKHVNERFRGFSKIQQLSKIIENQKHLGDIDSIWCDVEDQKTNLAELHVQMDSFVEKVNSTTARMINDISALQNYHALLETYTHLSDIDSIWCDVEDQKTKFLELNKQVEHFISETHESINTIKKAIDGINEQSIDRNLLVDKKIKIAYGIAGGSILVTIVQFILQITGIL